MKKGFAISFKWMFSMIAGVIILVFFIRFAFLQTGMNEKLEDREILASLSDQLESFSIAAKSNKEIDIGKEVNIKFRCENLSIGMYSKEMNKVIFARDISGRKINAWTLSWKYPFRTGNFFYLSDDKTKYYFFTYTNDLRYEQVPSRFNKIIKTNFDLEEVKRSVGENKAVLVFFNRPNFDASLDNIKAVYIDEDAGKVLFYNEGKESFFFGDELLYGAIFTADYEEYKCLLSNSIKRLKEIAYIYKDKAEKLKIKSNNCRSIYTNIINYINGFNFDGLIYNMDISGRDRLNEFNSRLNEQNKELNRNDCATLF